MTEDINDEEKHLALIRDYAQHLGRAGTILLDVNMARIKNPTRRWAHFRNIINVPEFNQLLTAPDWFTDLFPMAPKFFKNTERSFSTFTQRQEELINDAAEILETDVPLTNADISKIEAAREAIGKTLKSTNLAFQPELTASSLTYQPQLSASGIPPRKADDMQTRTDSPASTAISNPTELVMSASLMEEAELNKKLGLENNQKFLAKRVLEENLKNFAEVNKFKLVAVDELHKTHLFKNIFINNILNSIKVGLVFCAFVGAVFLVFRYSKNPDMRLGAIMFCVLACVTYTLANILKTPFEFFNEHFLYNHIKIRGTFDVPRYLSYKIPIGVKQKMSELLDARTFDKFVFHYHDLKGGGVPKNWKPSKISLLGIKQFENTEFFFLVEEFKPE